MPARRSVREGLIRGPRGWLAIPTATVETAAVSVLSDTMPPPSLEDVAARISPRADLPDLRGARGRGGEELNPAYYRAAKPPKSIWKIPESHHVGGLSARPDEYELRVIGFFNDALLGAAGVSELSR